MIKTIVLTDTFDSDTAVSLINHARIYRYLSQPITDTLLRLTIKTALNLYRASKANPVLLRREQTAPVPTTHAFSLPSKLMTRISGLRSRLGLSAS